MMQNLIHTNLLVVVLMVFFVGTTACQEDPSETPADADPLSFGDAQFVALSFDEKDTILMFVDDDKLDEPYMKVFREAAEKFQDQDIQFSYTSISTDAEEAKDSEALGDRMAYTLDLEGSEQPVLIGIDGTNYRPLYLKPDLSSLTVEDFEIFIQDLKANRTKGYLKTQQPFDNTAQSLITLVGRNFMETVTDQSKHSFVMVYNNQCIDCKTMAPVWQKIAKEYEGDSEIIISKMDGDKNHVDGLFISVYPTFLYYPKGANSQTEQNYDGGEAYLATFDDLKIWVEKSISDTDPNEAEADTARETEDL